MNGPLHPKILNVLDRRFTEHAIQTSRQRPRGGRQCIGDNVERNCRVEVFTYPTVETLDERVRMGKVIGNRIGRLRQARIEYEVPGDERRKLRAVIADQPEGK